MFRANKSCVIHAASGSTDIFGMPTPGLKYKERCAIVKLNIKSAKSAVRADTSATRGNALEFESDAVFLLTKNTVATIDDNIEILGYQLRIVSLEPRHDLLGNLDHYEVSCSYWMGA